MALVAASIPEVHVGAASIPAGCPTELEGVCFLLNVSVDCIEDYLTDDSF